MIKTLGQERVRVDFNPANSDLVSRLKMKAAEGIDLVETSIKQDKFKKHNAEAMRLASLAQTAFEEAAMWAVKAATA